MRMCMYKVIQFCSLTKLLFEFVLFLICLCEVSTGKNLMADLAPLSVCEEGILILNYKPGKDSDEDYDIRNVLHNHYKLWRLK